MRKLRGIGERVFISSFSVHFLSISSFSLHFLILSPFPLNFLIFSPFPLHFLILFSFPRSPAARLQRFVQPCLKELSTESILVAISSCSRVSICRVCISGTHRKCISDSKEKSKSNFSCNQQLYHRERVIRAN